VETYFEPYGEITNKACIKCHTVEKDPGFDFETDKELVSCGWPWLTLYSPDEGPL
jgi:hypothetical protein